MNSAFTHELKKKLAYKYGISIDEVNTIVRSMFELTSKTITSGDRVNFKFKNVHIPNLGMFMVKQGRLEHFKRKYGNTEIGDKEGNNNLEGERNPNGEVREEV